MSHESKVESQYLRPAEMAVLRRYFLVGRRPAEGLYTGRHASVQRGRSVEFTDYRQYVPGDNPADVDWKAFGRTDRLYVKRFEHQSDMCVGVLVDGSASMRYGGLESQTSKVKRRKSKVESRDLNIETRRSEGGRMGMSKFGYAAKLGSAVGFLAVHHQDRVALGIAQGGLSAYSGTGASMVHLQRVLGCLESVEPGGQADLPAAIEVMMQRLGKRGVMMVISDLLDEQSDILAGLSGYAHRGGEVVIFHVLHKDELRLPDIDSAIFADSETQERVTLRVEDVQRGYGRRIAAFVASWRTACRARGFDYHQVSTATPYLTTLRSYLHRREGG